LFVTVFVSLNATLAQVFIPFSNWSGASPVLLISHGITYNYGTISLSTPTDKILLFRTRETRWLRILRRRRLQRRPAGAGKNYNGFLDEVRIRVGGMSQSEVKADFKFMMNTNLFYGSAETGP